jgi:hypothetical protein
VAHQLIFTSSLRGIKPGASGYCTVLRSPGIKPSFERALEGLSVFEHIARNVGGSVQSLRHIELRGVTYYVLSRVSDAGKDYSGRTNFLAHFLVFEANELPAVSPVDLLLNWGGWCHTWSGEPREEAVDAASFLTVARMQAPAALWQQQTCGVSPAARLAAGADMKMVIQSSSLTSAELLQLIGEAFAIRAQLGQDASTTWQTSFAVGLASDSHAKDFTWIGAYWPVESVLLRQRELIDVAANPVNAGVVDAKALAIATTGRYVEPPKPIELTQNPAMRGVLDQALPEQGSVSSNRTRGARNPSVRRQAGKGATVKSRKKRSKLPIYVGLCVVLLTILLAVGLVGPDFLKDRELKNAYQKVVSDMEVLVKRGNVTKPEAEEILRILATTDTELNLKASEYINLNDDLIDVDPYRDVFDKIFATANPIEDVNTRVVATSNGADAMRERREEKKRKMDGEPILSGAVTESNAEVTVADGPVDPRKIETAPSKSIFSEQDRVSFVKVNFRFPDSVRSVLDEGGAKLYVCQNFMGAPLVSEGFDETKLINSKIRVGSGISLLSPIEKAYAYYAIRVTEVKKDELILIFGEKHHPVFEAHGRPLTESNTSDAYKEIEDQYLVSGLNYELVDVKGVSHSEPNFVVSTVPPSTPDVIKSVAHLCDLDEDGISMHSIQRWFLEERSKQIAKRREELEGDDKQKEVIGSLHDLESYLNKSDSTLEEFFEKAGELILEAESSSKANSSKKEKKDQHDAAKAELSHMGYSSKATFLDDAKKIKIEFLMHESKLKFKLSDRHFPDATGVPVGLEIPLREWSLLNRELEAYKDKSTQYLKAKAASDLEVSEKYEWSYLEIKDGDALVAKINLGDTK